MPRIRHDLLSGVRLFSGFDENTLATLGAKTKRRHLPMGTVAYPMGTQEIPLLVVLQGCIRLERPITDTETARLRLIGEGEAVDELSFASGLATSYLAIAIEDTIALELSHEDFVAIGKRHPNLYMSMIQSLAGRLRNCSDKVENLLALDASARLSREILDHMAPGSNSSKLDVSVPFSQEELAQRIGTRRETVNRCLKEMRAEGIVNDLGRNRYRVDVAGLYRTAGYTVVRTSSR